MSQTAFRHVVEDFESWNPSGPYEDVLCLQAFSKNVEGEIRRERREVQPCEELGCETLKSYFVGRAEASTGGECDDLPVLSGEWTDLEAVRMGLGGTPEGRAGHTGRFLWTRTGPAGVELRALVRFRGMSRVGTHRAPYFLCPDGEEGCERCHVPLHWEGWLRGAVVEGEHIGCRLWATYAFNIEEIDDDTARIEGAVEGLLGCQCNPDAD